MREKIEVLILSLVVRFVGVLPLSWSRALGGLAGKLSGMTNSRSCKVTRENIAICYPQLSPREQETLVQQSLVATGTLATEIFTVSQKPYNWLESRIHKVTGGELVSSALAAGKGVVILAPHIGNWEVLGLYLKTFGPVTSLYQPPKKAYLEAFTKQFREKQGANLVPTNQRGVAKILAALKKGQITGILPDQLPNEHGRELAPFFGEPAHTMTFVQKLLQKTDSVAIYAFAKRVKNGFELVFFDAPQEIYSEDLLTSLTALNKGVEQVVSHCPQQYQWEYKRFRHNGQNRYGRKG